MGENLGNRSWAYFEQKRSEMVFRTFETKKTHGSGERWLFAELKHSKKFYQEKSTGGFWSKNMEEIVYYSIWSVYRWTCTLRSYFAIFELDWKQCETINREDRSITYGARNYEFSADVIHTKTIHRTRELQLRLNIINILRNIQQQPQLLGPFSAGKAREVAMWFSRLVVIAIHQKDDSNIGREN